MDDNERGTVVPERFTLDELIFRAATTDDIPSVVECGEKHFSESSIGDFGKFDREAATTLITTLIDLPNSHGYIILALRDKEIVGLVLCAAILKHVLFEAQTVGTEISWWVHKDFRKGGLGGVLLDLYENWARSAGHSVVQLELHDVGKGKKIQKFVESKGYFEVGKTFMKRVLPEIGGVSS